MLKAKWNTNQNNRGTSNWGTRFRKQFTFNFVLLY